MDFDQISILSPLELSLRVASLATLFSFVAATLMAWLLARKRGPLPALLDALCTLPGVGEQRARAIIEYREQYGRFAAVEEAAAVPGLTEAVVDEWDGLAYVS